MIAKSSCFLLFTTIVIGLTSCKENFDRSCHEQAEHSLGPHIFKDTMMSVRSLNVVSDSIRDTLIYIPWDFKTYYFPGDSSNYPSASLDLYAMKEPILYRKSSKNEIYRFYWWRPFHHPIAIRIEKSDEEIRLFVKMYQFKNRGKLVLNTCRRITTKEWEQFKGLLEDAHYWSMIQFGADFDYDKPDASNWILEALDKNKYRIVKRPNGGTAEFKACCKYLVQLSGYQDRIL